MNKPSEQNASTNDQTAPAKTAPSYQPGSTKDLNPSNKDANASKDAPAKPTAAKGDDDAMSRPAQPQKTA